MYGGHGNSPIGESAGQRTNSNVWQDTSEEEMYGSYLNPGGAAAGGAAGSGMTHDVPMADDVPMLRPTMNARPSSNMGHQDIAVGQLDDATVVGEGGAAARKSFSGRKVVWPGALLLLFITAGALAAITYFGVQQYDAAQEQEALTESETTVDRKRTSKSVLSCELPDYVTADGKIYASSSTGKKEELVFTGINWSGMENAEGVPHGLASKQSYLDDIAEKLRKNDFNAVRLPLNAQMVLDNSPPDTTLFVNALATDLNVDTYIGMIKKVVQGLGKEQIGVLLDIHKIDPNFTTDTSEHLWYTKDYPISTMYTMYETLASELCGDLQYNIVGVDLKNEPVGGCWPADDSDEYCDSDVNWPRAVETIGNKILSICPSWLIVAEGNYATNNKVEINGENVTYNDWYGASLQNASVNPIALDMDNKLVFAPHFYSPSVYPSSYFFKKQSSSGDTVSVTEYPNTTAGNELLKAAVEGVLDHSFGDAVSATDVPMFYGEFGGIYGSAEKLPGLTSTRTIELLISYAAEMNMTGGFAWALNPDGSYDFNDAYQPKDPWAYGLYDSSKWDDYHKDFAAGLKKLQGSGPFPCFKTVSSTKATSGSGSATITAGSDDTSAAATATTTTSTTSSASAAAAAATTTTSATSSAATDATATTASSSAAATATAA